VTDELLVHRDAGVVTITINRPARRNALDRATFARLRDTLREIAANDDDRVVVVTGTGDAFCAGGDLTPVAEPAASDAAATRTPGGGTLAVMRSPIGEAALALHQLPQPSIAAVNGVAAGAGVNLAIGCDLVVAAESARFAELFVRRGLSIDFGGTWLLPRIVGLQQAKRMALLGDWYDAHEAQRLGLVTEVCADADLAGHVATMARRLAGHSPVALSMIKRGLNRAFDADMASALEHEALAQAACAASPAFAEAVAAFKGSGR
jgi:2-(1,2-epoxy-1,2-dihydrophenyl)acetyl-CoA isomerase